MVSLQEILSRNLRTARGRHGYSQADLGERAGLSAGYIADIERGHKFPSGNVLDRLSDALGLRPYQLLYDNESQLLASEAFAFSKLTSLKAELQERIAQEVDGTIRRYMKSDTPGAVADHGEEIED